MALETDTDTLEMSRALCTRAGMLLEDASAKAVLVGDLEPEQLDTVIQHARAMAARADALLAAAEALSEDRVAT